MGQWILIGIIGLFAGLPATRALISWVLDPFVRDDDLEKDKRGMLFFDANVASENRPVGTESEPTRKRDSKTDQAPGDATQTAASRVYHSSENGGGIAGVEVLIQIAKYAIIVFGFRGRGQRHCTVVSPTPIDRA